MQNFVSSNYTVGILGGGQLGRMLIQSAISFDLNIHILDPNPEAPASKYAHQFQCGDFRDYNAVVEFGKYCDLITVEIEDVNTDALRTLKKQGKVVHPDPDVLDLIRDKGNQKEFYAEKGLPTAPFKLYPSTKEIIGDINRGEIAPPFVQKLRTGGYDGKGVQIVKDTRELTELLQGPCLIEQIANIDKELAVIVAGSDHNNEITCFPPVEMLFDPKANLVEFLSSPADIDAETAKEAQEIAVHLYKEMNMRGLLAVELFLNKDGSIWINEVAPRPHNSGHHSIEGNLTSQFEQHLRSILNAPLGNTAIKKPSVMVNLLGADGEKGPVLYEGLDEIMELPGVYPHLYGKKEVSPFRKMGHVSCVAETREQAIALGREVKEKIKVVAKK
ncbi:5-(carboxyamino)imidazole ribonucleotide synthase [Luteibaculum oceani]|uniref:N5-carboxyaminoimidazole ribonucleotide synthase n=1 Tax=Luteibaculum oceani TaxID=1294296 RepID=A0A5C6UV27_9FLAO|nr:5-(carboxyamino)imidazole ribonucleotide synthase [Luteibaculum oceani]TXC76091.1 5-(carboxyamino)imidazole ribonucleotide synthase [Luteibaculum oceani]